MPISKPPNRHRQGALVSAAALVLIQNCRQSPPEDCRPTIKDLKAWKLRSSVHDFLFGPYSLLSFSQCQLVMAENYFTDFINLNCRLDGWELNVGPDQLSNEKASNRKNGNNHGVASPYHIGTPQQWSAYYNGTASANHLPPPEQAADFEQGAADGFIFNEFSPPPLSGAISASYPLINDVSFSLPAAAFPDVLSSSVGQVDDMLFQQYINPFGHSSVENSPGVELPHTDSRAATSTGQAFSSVAPESQVLVAYSAREATANSYPSPTLHPPNENSIMGRDDRGIESSGITSIGPRFSNNTPESQCMSSYTSPQEATDISSNTTLSPWSGGSITSPSIYEVETQIDDSMDYQMATPIVYTPDEVVWLASTASAPAPDEIEVKRTCVKCYRRHKKVWIPTKSGGTAHRSY
jgi:hypothetical protein